MLHQFIKYAMIGALNVTLFLVLFNVFRRAGLSELPANVLAFIPTNINSFLLNKRWAFRDQREHWVLLQYLRFAALTLISLVINEVVFLAALIPLREHGWVGENIAALVPLPLTVAWNFFSYRFWAFNKRPAST